VDGVLESQSPIDSESDSEGLDTNDNEDTQDYQDIYEPDPVAAWGGRLTDQVIRDPREYFLWVVQMRMEQALQEYGNLVKTLNHGITEHVCRHLSIFQFDF
jgi:hypothetical protein